MTQKRFKSFSKKTSSLGSVVDETVKKGDSWPEMCEKIFTGPNVILSKMDSKHETVQCLHCTKVRFFPGLRRILWYILSNLTAPLCGRYYAHSTSKKAMRKLGQS